AASAYAAPRPGRALPTCGTLRRRRRAGDARADPGGVGHHRAAAPGDGTARPTAARRGAGAGGDPVGHAHRRPLAGDPVGLRPMAYLPRSPSPLAGGRHLGAHLRRARRHRTTRPAI
ncbi:MAG: hypothetical protein AVDCRST_MAG40-1259, partial [uncultured Gemmatimonadaceae bacterium]